MMNPNPRRPLRRHAMLIAGVGLLSLGLSVAVPAASAAKPAPGTVGRAMENSNPKGQADPDSPDRGHRCDDNKGVGQGNPAHDTCESTATVEETTTTTEATTTTTEATTTTTEATTTTTEATTTTTLAAGCDDPNYDPELGGCEGGGT